MHEGGTKYLNVPSTSNLNSLSERFIETEDPDIQIIEQPVSAGRPAIPLKGNRKRAYTNGYKKHVDNVLYKTTLQEHVKNLADKGITANQHEAIALRLKVNF